MFLFSVFFPLSHLILFFCSNCMWAGYGCDAVIYMDNLKDLLALF